MAENFRYLDKSLSPEERAKDLVCLMTVEERASQLRYDAPSIPRLGVPAYNWWNEALHGVARAGTATMYPQAIGLAAAFDEDLMEEIGGVVATEGRAKYNASVAEGDRDIYKGLTFWSPNVNIFRDPRWGRGQETYGEDPYLSGRLGVRFVNGVQQKNKDGVMKAAACAKHFAVHSGPEALRHEFDAVVNDKDLWETYLPAFEDLVTEAGVEAVMPAYNRTDGEPCAGSKMLLQEILRGKWNFQGHVVSDCWAIKDFHENHKVTKTVEESAAKAIQAGTDINCGSTYAHMMEAYREGLVSEEEITRAAIRAMTTRMRLGMFDQIEEYDSIPYSEVCSKEHLASAQKAAKESFVLLKNDGILPLNKKNLKNIAVIGPNADSRSSLDGNYHGTGNRYITVLEGIQDYAGEDARVYYAQGCHISRDRTEGLGYPNDRISEAVTVAKLSDVVILCLGLNEFLEGEEGDASNADASGDKKDLEFPESQRALLEAVVKTGKPVILLVMTGSAMALGYADEHCSAVAQVWYPGAQGGKAVAEMLFGEFSPSGKLPVTFYRDTADLPDFLDYSMENRTYRNFKGIPLYPFGYGLTYSTVKVTEARLSGPARTDSGCTITAQVTNSGKTDTGEVLEVYVKSLDSQWAVRNHSLCAFKRVFVKAGETITVDIPVSPKAFRVVNDKGERIVDSKNYRFFVGVSQPDARSTALTGSEPAVVEISLNN